MHFVSAVIYRCFWQGVTPEHTHALGETKHAAPVIAFRYGEPGRMGSRRRRIGFPVPDIRYQRARVQLACT